jgi:hypothetical protein
MPNEYTPSALARFSFGYRSEIIECDGGDPPASPMPTPVLAISMLVKLFAMPVNAVNKLQKKTEILIIFIRL